MINHYFFLRKLAAGLHHTLAGSTIAAIVSPHKDEIQLFFDKKGQSQLIRLNWETDQFLIRYHNADIGLPKVYEKQLFDGWNRRILAVEQAFFDRYWLLRLDDNYTIVIKCFASAGNAMLLHHNTVTSVFRRSRQRDFAFELDKIVPEAEAALLTHDPRFSLLSQKVDAVGGIDWLTWSQHASFGWQPSLGIYPDQKPNTQAALDLANQHAAWYLGHYLYNHRMAKLKAALAHEMAHLESKIAHAESHLQQIAHQLDYQTQGSLLLSHMQSIQPGAKQVSLPRWDLPHEQVQIKIDPTKSIVENANRLFLKAKNQHIEQEKREQYLQHLRDQLAGVEEKQAALHKISSWRDLLRFEQKQPAKTQTVHPWRVYHIGNLEVWVGKNAQGNDEILRRAHKDDLWLHARGVAGSHVLIRNAGKKLTQPLLEKAAAWAAFFSKGRSEQLCPVSYSERKFIRKPKGAAAGAVIMEREKVIIVAPLAPATSE